MKSWVKSLLAKVLPPVFFAIAFLAVWEFLVRWLEVSSFILPPPSKIALAGLEEWSVLLQATLFTMLTALAALILSLIVGVLLACLFAQSPWIRNALNPYAILLQTTPIITIAPLIILWFGEGWPSVVAIAFVISFFPILTGTTIGMTSVPANFRDLFRLSRASRWQFLWKLQLPYSIPYLIAGLKTSGGLSVLGAVIGDYFAGYSQQQQGLGYLFFQYQERSIPLVFCCIALSTSLGVLFFLVIGILANQVLWRWSQTDDAI